MSIHLIGTVEETDMLTQLHEMGDDFPLLKRRIYTCWIMRASMEQENGIFGSFLKSELVLMGDVPSYLLEFLQNLNSLFFHRNSDKISIENY